MKEAYIILDNGKNIVALGFTDVLEKGIAGEYSGNYFYSIKEIPDEIELFDVATAFLETKIDPPLYHLIYSELGKGKSVEGYLLSLPEASLLSGIKYTTLKNAVHEKKLAATYNPRIKGVKGHLSRSIHVRDFKVYIIESSKRKGSIYHNRPTDLDTILSLDRLKKLVNKIEENPDIAKGSKIKDQIENQKKRAENLENLKRNVEFSSLEKGKLAKEEIKHLINKEKSNKERDLMLRVLIELERIEQEENKREENEDN